MTNACVECMLVDRTQFCVGRLICCQENSFELQNPRNETTKRTRSLSGVFHPNKFRSHSAFQTHENYFRDATPLLEKTCWSIFTSWHWNSTMVYSQGLELSSLRSGWSLWEFGKRILCQCNCERWRLKCWIRRKFFQSLLHIWQRYFTSTDRCLKTH